ncbi:hypothetical protein DZS_35730 [Dickeya ananatis]
MTTQSINRSADSQPIDALLDKVALAFCRLKAINSVTDGAPTHETLTIQFEEWDWEVGVGLYGFWKLARQRQDSAMLAALEQWYEQKITGRVAATANQLHGTDAGVGVVVS